MRASLRIVLLTTAAVLGVTHLSMSFAASHNSGDSEAMHSLLGSYLAANFARGDNDVSHATTFYRNALALDPDNELLLEQAFQAEASEANWNRAVPLANKLVELDPSHRLAHLVIGLSSFKAGDYTRAEKEFSAAKDGLIGELTSGLAGAWAALAAGDANRALKLVTEPKNAEGAKFYLTFHQGLIADVGGKRREAASAYQRSLRLNGRMLRTGLGYARHAAHEGKFKLANSILDGLSDGSQDEEHPLITRLREEIKAGGNVPLLVESPAEGIAETFYGLGELLTNEGGVGMGIIYLQMALYVQPDNEYALMALARAYEQAKRYEDAIATYDRIPRDIAQEPENEIRKAFDLNSLDRVDEAKAILEDLAMQSPDDIKPLDALGTILRSRKRYAEAVEYYDRALTLVPTPSKRHWALYYSRGTCYERLKDWPLAEADLKTALDLYPDQPMVLNYLGYSWVDQNRNLKEGMELIEKAVGLRPDDGYIVDSLGWAHYKLGNYPEAVRFLERAVELKPQDPVLNDHLGDALWRVGREREARFQWDQALTLEPEPEDAEKIKKKLADGLAMSVQVQATPETMRNVRLKKRKETNLNPAQVE
jgi:tetratricopeptide (TPR) repeat protein